MRSFSLDGADSFPFRFEELTLGSDSKKSLASCETISAQARFRQKKSIWNPRFSKMGIASGICEDSGTEVSRLSNRFYPSGRPGRQARGAAFLADRSPLAIHNLDCRGLNRMPLVRVHTGGKGTCRLWERVGLRSHTEEIGERCCGDLHVAGEGVRSFERSRARRAFYLCWTFPRMLKEESRPPVRRSRKHKDPIIRSHANE